ncbi:phage terminase large subunit [Patescibacteria group bacterium]|nr:phage terminase large subunit [Patescibacteria group bacterium]
MNEAELVRSICHESFYAFLQEFWYVVVPEKPVWNWHIEYLCNTFQKGAERVFRGEPKLHDTIVNIPPGTTKSTILSIMAPAWLHARRPDIRVLAASHTQNLTFELGRKCRMVEESELYRKVFPEVKPSHDQWTKSLFMNDAGGGRMACTVGGMSPVGFHAHFIIVDDPLDPQQASRVSEVELGMANNFMSEVLPTRKVDKDVTITWLIMQRLHQNDPSGFLLSKSKENIRHICLPAERSPKVKPVRLRRRYTEDGLLDPVRLSRSILDEAKIDLGEYGYAGQYQQHPVPRGGGMFKTERIEIDVPPPLTSKHWVGLCRFWDKAGTAGGGAYTVGFLMGRWRPAGAPKDGSDDNWWILDVVREQLDSGERERLIKAVTHRDGKRVIVGLEQEPGSGGKESAQATVKRLAGYRVRVVPAVGSKEERADEWSTQVNMGVFKMREAQWNITLVDEMRYFPFSAYKDQVDAGAGAFTILANLSRRVGGVT